MNDLLSPIKAVMLAGKTYGRRPSGMITSCPSCGGACQIIGPSFVCGAEGCAFERGSAVDYLAVGRTYAQAIELAGSVVPFYRERVEEEERAHRLKRRLTDFAIAAARQNRQPEYERIILKNRFSEFTGVPSGAFVRGHWFLTTVQSLELQMILFDLEKTPPAYLHGKPAAVAPYWGNHHSVSTIQVLGNGRGDPQTCEIEAFRHSWFGLQQADNQAKRVTIYPTHLEAMVREEVETTINRDEFPTALHVNLEATTPGEEFEHMTFKAKGAGWHHHLPRWSYVEGFEQAEFETDGYGRSSLIGLLTSLAVGSDFQQFLDMCAGMKIGPSLQAHLLEVASRLPSQRDAQRLRRTMSRRLLDVDERGAIYECADGYQVETGGQCRQATNFTLEFDSVTCFSALVDVVYNGRAHVGVDRYEFDIPSRKLENPSQLSDVLQSIQTITADPDRPTATIFRPKEFRRVLEVLRVRNADLTRLRGVSALGWNRKHDQFVMPQAVIDRAGIHSGVRYFPDEEGEHHCYDSKLPGPGGVPTDMPVFDPYLAEIISALVSQMIRYHHGLKVRLWPLINNAGTREQAGRLFAGLGQTSPLRLTKIIPRNLELNRGLPCLVAPLSNDLQAGKLQLAGALLSSRGTDLSRIPDGQIDQAAMVLAALLADVSRRILVGESVSFAERRSIRPQGTTALEGAALIRTDYWAAWPEAGLRQATIDRGLEIGEPRITELLAIDEKEDATVVRPAFWLDAGIDSDDLLLDFGLCSLKVRRTDAGILVDRLSMNRHLGEFYGEVPALQLA